MNPFAFTQATDVDAALAALLDPDTRPIAGGTNLLDLMKESVMKPSRLVDINNLGLDQVEEKDGGLLLGALARNADTAYHPVVRERYPLLSTAILAGASPQLRNMASNGGNLMQRTRCVYFYDVGTACNKREPGTGCPAREGLNRQLAILGTSESCIATHPSDMCVALRALDATVHVRSMSGAREIPFADFHRLPGDTPQIDNTLQPGEMITHITVPEADRFIDHSAYIKVRDRLSYAFALVSVATVILPDGTGRVAVGGVAHKPWRVEAAEQQMGAGAKAVADRLMAGAKTTEENAFKVPLVHRILAAAMQDAKKA